VTDGQETPPVARLALLTVVLALLAAVAVSQLRLSYTLTFFLPEPQTPSQRVLADRLGQGPGAALLFVDIGSAGQAARSRLLSKWQQAPPPGIAVVWPREDSTLAVPGPLMAGRLALAPQPQDADAWARVLADRANDLASVPDDALFDLVARDPTLQTLGALQQFLPAVSRSGPQNKALLVLQATAPVFAIAEQQEVLAALRAALTAAGAPDARIYGTAAYGASLQKSVSRESALFTGVAGLALAVLVGLRFRSLRLVIVSALSLAVGGATGLALLALTSPVVHGITLAFGFTLLGVAIDYPLHTLTHRQLGASDHRELWRTLSLGVASTLCAYGAFLLSGAQGISQLGLFAIGGITGAALATRFLDTSARAPRLPTAADAPAPPRELQLNHAPWLLALALTMPVLLTDSPFSNDLSALTPVPAATLAEDTALRRQFGTVDLRYLIALSHRDQDAVLAATERLSRVLDAAVQAGELSGYGAVSAILPSAARQTQHWQALQRDPAADRSAFNAALAASPFAADAFDGYWQDRAPGPGTLPAPALADFPATSPLGSALRAQLYERGDEWHSLVYLRGLAEPRLLAQRLRSAPASIAADRPILVDLKQAANRLVASYRDRLLLVESAALGLVLLLLWLATRELRRAIWLTGCVAAAVAVSAAVALSFGRALSLFDLVSLALVAGLGLDYGLFYSTARGAAQDYRARHRAVSLCALSSLLVFGILSLSSVPLLRGIGLTVAVGVVAAYLLTRLGRYRLAADTGGSNSSPLKPRT
jgi:predicted exporter